MARPTNKIGVVLENTATKGNGQGAYSFSFISGALYVPECIAVAEQLRTGADWRLVSERTAAENILRLRTAASRTRVLREVRHRLQQLNHKELQFLCEAGSRDQRLLLFIAVCGRFRFIREFVEEVLRPKWSALEHQLYPADFARFFDRKGAEAPEVEKLTDKSRAKVKQVLTRMLAEAGFLDSTTGQRIQHPVPSKALVSLIAETDANRLRFLLLSDADCRQNTR